MSQLRLATLNCLNLALAQRRTYEGLAPYSANEYLAKTQWLAGLFDRMAADLVLVQEVFQEAALSDVIRQTTAGPQGWRCAAPLAPQDNAKPRVGAPGTRRSTWRSNRSMPCRRHAWSTCRSSGRTSATHAR